MNPESRDSGFDAEPVIGPRFARTRWHRPGMTVVDSTSRLQRLVDRVLEHAVDIVGRYRADQLVGYGAVAADHERLRHAIDAPFDGGAAVAVDADDAIGVAVAAEKTPRIVGPVLLVDAAHLQPRVLAEFGQ